MTLNSPTAVGFEVQREISGIATFSDKFAKRDVPHNHFFHLKYMYGPAAASTIATTANR
jgi:hypothetical protein